MAINGWGAEKHGSEKRHVAPVTVAAINLSDFDNRAEQTDYGRATRKMK
jgi:hypothetical protein